MHTGAHLARRLLLLLPLWGGSVLAAESGERGAAITDQLVLGTAERVTNVSSHESQPRYWQGSQWSSSQPLPEQLQTPLGSLWKLFVYSYLTATQAKEPPLRCEGKEREEVYCCDPGESIDREQALIRSCGLYFAPKRLGIPPGAWQRYWQGVQAPGWLYPLAQLNEVRTVRVAELLQALAAIPPKIRQIAGNSLSEVLLQGRGKGGVGELGTLLRIKSFTMPLPTRATMGGGAGWSDNGTPLWFAGQGSSSQVITRLAPRLAARLQQEPAPNNQECVQVHFFARYPLQRIEQREEGQVESDQAVKPGPLLGHYRLTFAKGNQLEWQATGATFWLEQASGQPPTIWGRLNQDEYVARVVDREGEAQQRQAARALAVAARSYLLQEASHQGSCLQLADSSRYQRVSPQPPSRLAQEAARATAGLALSDVAVRYHSQKSAPNRLSWQQAVAWQQEGLDFVAILARAYPQSHLQLAGSRSATACQPLTSSQFWLQHNQSLWRKRLQQEPGFEPVTPRLCLLKQGRPYADKQQQRIYVRPSPNQEGRIALTHEYLHLAFAHHPSGEDETYIEQLARSLVRGEE